MAGYVSDIEQQTEENDFFRKVLFTGPHAQLVVMTLKPGEEIGLETHDDTDQFLRIEKGEGVAIIEGERFKIGDGSAVVIPAGVEHNIVNESGAINMRLYTLYTPPQHPDGTIHKTPEEAHKAEEAEEAKKGKGKGKGK
jgi:mannose-6-phosphate isomerase-like protein (cupin superfamily)